MYRSTDPLEIFLANTYPIFQIVVFAAFLAFDLIAGKGRARSSGHPLLYSKSGAVSPLFLIYSAVMLLFSNVGAQRQYQYDFGSDMIGVMIAIFVFAVLPVYLVRNVLPFLKGLDYLLVKHPAEPIVRPPLQEARGIDANRLADALSGTGGLDASAPTYHYENQSKKARALARDIEQDAQVTEALARQRRAQAEYDAAERELKQAKQQRGKRR